MSRRVILGEAVPGRPPSALLKTAKQAQWGPAALPLGGRGSGGKRLPTPNDAPDAGQEAFGVLSPRTVVQVGAWLARQWEGAVPAFPGVSTDLGLPEKSPESQHSPPSRRQMGKDGRKGQMDR